MSLNHVSDKDIVECLHNCPELDVSDLHSYITWNELFFTS